MRIVLSAGSGFVAVLIGVVEIGLSVALAAFIASIDHGPGPSDQLVRASCFGALFGAAGAIAILGGRRQRPALIAAAGVISIGASILSVVTLGFAVIGLALLVGAAAVRPSAANTRRRASEIATGGLIVALVAAGAIALLGTTERRCWVAYGSPEAPTYAYVPCEEGPVSVGGPDGSFASGEDGGVLSPLGVMTELGLLAAAVLLAAARPRTRPAAAL